MPVDCEHAVLDCKPLQLCAVDNGRVVGYDNQHGYHHRHYFGDMHPVDFVSFEETEADFEADWMALRR